MPDDEPKGEETLDETAKRMIREENERTRKLVEEGKITLGGHGVGNVKDEVEEEEGPQLDPDSPEYLKRYRPGVLKEQAKNEIVAKCHQLIEMGWVTEWEIRNILRDLAPTFGKTKYMPGYGKGPD
jgi:hypothetical protein